MAHRRIRQEAFRFTTKADGQTSLDALTTLIDLAAADRALAGLYPSAKGEKAWPPLAMVKVLLLATWYDLSDVMLAEALSDRASFRRLGGFARDEATPERTAFVRLRRELVGQGLDRSLFKQSRAIANPRALASAGGPLRNPLPVAWCMIRFCRIMLPLTGRCGLGARTVHSA